MKKEGTRCGRIRKECTFEVFFLKKAVATGFDVDTTKEVEATFGKTIVMAGMKKKRIAPLVVSPFRSRKREYYEPATEQKVLEWLIDRQENMNTAFMAGNLVEVSSTYLWDDHRFVQKLRTNRGASVGTDMVR